MKKRAAHLALVIGLMLAAMGMGVIFQHRGVLPWPPNNKAYHLLRRCLGRESMCGAWAIGIYEGTSPFELAPANETACPILTARDVTDTKAKYVADPFLFIEDNTFHLFFEVMNDAQQGDIGYAQSPDGREWTYQGLVIDEPFHLSYPGVFKWNGDYYMIPESSEDLSIRLYRATSFPDRWEYVTTLLGGFAFVDPTILRYKDKWWIFVGGRHRDALNCFFSDELLTGWRPHPQNPIVRFDRKLTSPAGRIVDHDGHLYRVAQDCRRAYGQQVFAIEITELSETTYSENMVKETPIVTASRQGWNATGMHHVDLHLHGDRWIAAVDGRGW